MSRSPLELLFLGDKFDPREQRRLILRPRRRGQFDLQLTADAHISELMEAATWGAARAGA